MFEVSIASRATFRALLIVSQTLNPSLARYWPNSGHKLMIPPSPTINILFVRLITQISSPEKVAIIMNTTQLLN